MDALLHVGIEHPNLFWIGVTGVVAFAVGTWFGAFVLEPKLDAAESADGSVAER